MKTSIEHSTLYHDGARAWQGRFDSRRLADRIERTLVRDALNDGDRAFIEGAALFFLATADVCGRPDVSHKAGRSGFVRVLDAATLAFPSYDGNGMFLSLGNLSVQPRVALLFIDFERPARLRVHGAASAAADDPLRDGWAGAQAVVRVAVDRVFPNCPRYIHRMQRVETSAYAPCEGVTPPVPAWKRCAAFRDVLPRGDPAAQDSPHSDLPCAAD